MVKNKFIKNCAVCDKEFEVWRYRLKTVKFCSKKCANIYKIDKPNCSKTKFIKGQRAWNKGIECPWAHHDKQFKKGQVPWNKGIKDVHHSLQTEFKIGQFANELHPFWKGDSAKYHAMHKWIYRHKGNPELCEHCGKTHKEKRIEWANINHLYTRKPDDYIPLCVSCHRKYDLEKNNYRKPFSIRRDAIRHTNI